MTTTITLLINIKQNNMEQTNKINPNHLRGVIILKEIEEDKRFAVTEEKIKQLKKVKQIFAIHGCYAQSARMTNDRVTYNCLT